MKKNTSSKPQAWCIAAVSMFALLSNITFAQDDAPISSNQNVRFYKVNKAMKGNRIMLTKKKTSQVGCHNFIKQVRVHRAVQTGFIACSLYEYKDCPLASVVPVAREKQPRRTYLLTEGRAWLPQSEEERGVEVKSWQCDMKLEADFLGHDYQLAKTEIVRLRVKAEHALEIAERAQKKADRAKKLSEDAIELATAALKRAVDAGYELPPEMDEDSDNEEDTGEEMAAYPSSDQKPKKEL
jgi:hypothetical protein